MEIRDIGALLDYWDGIRSRTHRVVDRIPAERFDWSPRDGAWSFADLLRHLGSIERWMFTENAFRRPSRYPGCGPRRGLAASVRPHRGRGRGAQPAVSGRAGGSAVVALLVAGCGSPEALPEPLDGYPHATAMADCAPWDGIATSIFLSTAPLDPAAPPGSEVPRPHLWISVYRGVDALAGERFEIDQERTAGSALCDTAGPCRPVTGGWIRFRDASTRETLVGEFEIELGPAGAATRGTAATLAAGFRARWHERTFLCG